MHVVGDFGDVDSIVAQPLEFVDQLVVFVQDINVLLLGQMTGQVGQVPGGPVGQQVDIVFFRLDCGILFLIIGVDQSQGFLDILFGGQELGHQDIMRTAQGQGRGGIEDRVELFQLVLVFVFRFRLRLDDLVAEFFKDRNHRQQQDGTAEVEDGVGIGNPAGVDHFIPDAVQHPELAENEDAEQHQDRFIQVIEDINDTNPLGVFLGADRADDGSRDAVAQIHTDDDGIDFIEHQLARSREGLQDTDGGG